MDLENIKIYPFLNSWKKKEIGIVKDNYSKMTWGELAKFLPDRTPCSIHMKAQRMGLRRTKEELYKIKSTSSKKNMTGFRYSIEAKARRSEMLRKLYLNGRRSITPYMI